MMKSLIIDKNIDNKYNFISEYIDENGLIVNDLLLNKINILVGENNSGKSRFMRNILNTSSNSIIYYVPKSSDGGFELNNLLSQIARRLREGIDADNLEEFKKEFKEYELEKEKTKKVYHLRKMFMKYIFVQTNSDPNLIMYITNDLLSKKYFEYVDKDSDSYNYIPILRGIENFDNYFLGQEKLNNISMTIEDVDNLHEFIAQGKEIYLNKISKIYKVRKKLIFTGEKMYDEITDILLGDEERRETFHEFEKFIDKNFYQSEGFKINPSREKNCLMVKIRNEKERELYNLGDGIKQIIIMLYPIFMNKNRNKVFFIEEPEINLHPGFQRKFMELLINEDFGDTTFILNTHSNHIIDMINETDKINIFKFKKKNDKFEITNIDSDYATVLNELGVRTSSVFLSNCTIWVEGISDRIYIKKYLELYFKKDNDSQKYKEGIHYSFVEYGGSNITHWNFDENEESELINTKFLSNNIFLVVDNDNTSSSPNSAKEKRKQKLKAQLGDRFYELNKREIENLISIEILEKMLKEDNGGELNQSKYTTERWNDNEKRKEYYKPATYIGEFITNTYKGIKKYQSTTGKTIRNKADFAYKICNTIETWEDLTEDAQDLTEKIAKFIESNN